MLASMSNGRHVNFSPGPSTLPLPALERAQAELLNFQGSGMSIMEQSHRGRLYEAVHDEAIRLLTQLYAIPESHRVLFMQGGASAQFALLPMNLRSADHAGDYVITGTWARKAYKEAAVVGAPHVAWDEAATADTYIRVPAAQELELSSGAPYVHLTTNNTIMGTQFHVLPETGTVPLALDMSSDILSRPLEFMNIGVIYAGAQKNMGPAGITVLIVRRDLIERSRTDIPSIFQYRVVAENNSLQNTIPTFPVYMVRNVLQWLQEAGGVAAIEKQNQTKARLLYETIDGSGGFYHCPVEVSSRSIMNVVFRLPSADAEQDFVAKAAAAGLVGLKGHRSVGGIRASIYNAMPLSGVERLVDFMNTYRP